MIAIHDRPGSFSDRWIEYSTNHSIPFRRVNCLATDVVTQCKGLDAVLWHWAHNNPAEQLVARQVIASLETIGLTVFPNVKTCWHYDDKVAQKYLLEAIGAPLIPTWVFTDKKESLDWIAQAAWPKVFKLRCGAGSKNVRLVSSRREAEKLCRRAFGRGFPAVAGYMTDLRTRVRSAKSKRAFWEKLRRAPRTLLNILALRRSMAVQRDYIYFQEFLAENVADTRITIIGDRAFGFLRQNRPNDFRASGSGAIVYEPSKVDKRCIQVGFQVAKRLGTQSLAFDFLLDRKGTPQIGEVSYCYMAEAVRACPGHWDHEIGWHGGHTWPQDAILEDLLETVANLKNRKGVLGIPHSAET